MEMAEKPAICDIRLLQATASFAPWDCFSSSSCLAWHLQFAAPKWGKENTRFLGGNMLLQAEPQSLSYHAVAPWCVEPCCSSLPACLIMWFCECRGSHLSLDFAAWVFPKEWGSSSQRRFLCSNCLVTNNGAAYHVGILQTNGETLWPQGFVRKHHFANSVNVGNLRWNSKRFQGFVNVFKCVIH